MTLSAPSDRPRQHAADTGAGTEPGRLSLLGHDLRSAVSDIIGGLRLIDQSGLDDAARLQLERIRASGEVLARLLEETLALMLGEEDFAATHPANVQMARLLYDIEMRWSGRAKEKGLAFEVSVAPDVPQVLALDRIALERVLANLLSNAVKYTDRGRIRLTVGLAPNGALTMTVDDDGPGFSDAALARLFEYAGRPEDAPKPGQGMGMHISKNMTGRLGGTIRVSNRAGGGASVTLELPPDRWTMATPDATVRLPDLSRIKVLVAEDNPTNQTILAHMLARMGAACEIASDGVEAIHWLERERFDLALIDIEMPRLSGLDVIRALRSNDRLHSHMPIIAVTAYVLRSNRDMIYEAGADAILTKPLAGIETVGQAIARALSHEGVAVAPPEAGDTAPPLNRDRFDHLLDIAGPDGAGELVERLHEDLAGVAERLGRGLPDADWSVIRAETHVLIALAGAVGAERLQRLAETLNAQAHRKDAGDLGRIADETMQRLAELQALVAAERVKGRP